MYELPVGSKRCPVCSSKRLQQLFNNPNVIARGAAPEPDSRLTSSSHLVRSTTLMQPEADRVQALKAPADMKSMGVNDFADRIGVSRAVANAAIGAPGKARPMTSLEERRHARQYPGDVPDVLMRTRKAGVPTIPVGRPRE